MRSVKLDCFKALMRLNKISLSKNEKEDEIVRIIDETIDKLNAPAVDEISQWRPSNTRTRRSVNRPVGTGSTAMENWTRTMYEQITGTAILPTPPANQPSATTYNSIRNQPVSSNEAFPTNPDVFNEFYHRLSDGREIILRRMSDTRWIISLRGATIGYVGTEEMNMVCSTWQDALRNFMAVYGVRYSISRRDIEHAVSGI